MKIYKKLPAIIYAGSGFSIFLVLLIGASSLFFFERQKSKENWILHNYQVLDTVHSVYHHLFEMGMDKQRFRSTGIPMFFQSYHMHSDSLIADLSSLKVLVNDNHQQVMRIITLQRQFGDLLRFWQGEGVNLKNSKAGSLLSVNWAEKSKIDAIRAQMLTISQVERKLLQQREVSDTELREGTEFTIVAGTLFILVLVCFLIYFILQELKNRFNAYQKEKEMNQLKSNFISLASHEFRTPLTSIVLSASLIEKHVKATDSGTILKHCRKIKTTVDSLKCILEDFLSLEKLNTGKIKAVFQPFDLVELCEDIMEEMQHIAPAGQNLSFEHSGTVRTVNLDKNLVRNAIINLVTNAVKYAGDSTLIMLKADISATNVTITIKDNGIGIPEQDQEHLFTPFFRVNNTGNIPGTGLGLSIVSRYVNLMQGDLFFSSVPNKETCFGMSFAIAS